MKFSVGLLDAIFFALSVICILYVKEHNPGVPDDVLRVVRIVYGVIAFIFLVNVLYIGTT